jgi:competence protein ComEC
MRILSALVFAAGVIAQPAWAQTPTKTLQIYYVDTEGGQSTLFVAPSGESLLVDVGNPGGRDTDRIMLALEDAGVRQIDHLVLTHYHGDHVGGLAELAKRVSIKRFYDHGPAAEGDRAGGQGFMEQYAQIHANAVRTIVKPGDKLSIPGLDITVVTSAGQVLTRNLPGAGRPNPACAGFAEKDLSKVFDPDNAYSVGFVLGFGRFRTIDLGDLTWNHEGQLMCPANRLGTVDLYLVSHHGINQSNSAALVHGLQPRVAVMKQRDAQGGLAGNVPDARVFSRSRGLVAAALVA